MKSKKTGWGFSIGYGLGMGLAQTRMNALSACHEAELRKNVSYLMSEGGTNRTAWSECRIFKGRK